MIVDQSEIDALLREADHLSAEAERLEGSPSPRLGGQPAAGPARAPLDTKKLPPEVRRLLRLKVPLIVQLAERRMPVAAIRRLSLGTIIEFDRSAERPLDVLINNQPVGVGEAVKVNEKFGLRVQGMNSIGSRVRALGS
jgi:flagellar motor switch/type III secretory pathway protein FliN